MESDKLDSSIARVVQQIRDVKASIEKVELEATRAKDAGDAEERKIWLTKKRQLRTKEQQLRTKKQQLRDEIARKEALQQGASLTAARALPAGPGLQNFWDQLVAVEQLSTVGSACLLQLGSNAHFPPEGSDVQGRLIVRQCYVELSQILQDYFAARGHSFIITGNSGIGKSLFLYFLMWQLAHSGKTIVWDRHNAKLVVMFSPAGVSQGELHAFTAELDNPQTWYLVDGKPPVDTAAKTVLVTSLDWDMYKGAYKRPDSLLRHMPTWSWEEIQAARQHIFSSQPEADVASRYSRWGGIPRYVLQKTDAADQALLQKALNQCSLGDLTRSLTNLSCASESSHMLLHLTVDAGYLEGPVVFASDWVQGEVISRCLQFRRHEVHDFLAASGGEPTVAAFRGALWEHFAHVALQRGGSFSCKDLQNTQAGPFEIELEPCSSSVGLWDLQDITTELGSGVYGWGRSKNLPAIDAVVQPDKLFQITVSGDHGVNAKGLADAVRAMRAEERAVQLYFVVPPHVFRCYTKQTLKRIRGDLEAENVARAVKQFVLKVGIRS